MCFNVAQVLGLQGHVTVIVGSGSSQCSETGDEIGDRGRRRRNDSERRTLQHSVDRRQENMSQTDCSRRRINNAFLITSAHSDTVRQCALIMMRRDEATDGQRNNFDQHTSTHARTHRGYFLRWSIDMSPVDIWPSCATLATHRPASLFHGARLPRSNPPPSVGWPVLQSFHFDDDGAVVECAAKSTPDFLICVSVRSLHRNASVLCQSNSLLSHTKP